MRGLKKSEREKKKRGIKMQGYGSDDDTRHVGWPGAEEKGLVNFLFLLQGAFGLVYLLYGICECVSDFLKLVICFRCKTRQDVKPFSRGSQNRGWGISVH